MGENSGESTISIYPFLYFITEKIFEYIGIDQSKMFEEVLTNIFKNNDLEHLSKIIPSDILKFNFILIKESDRGAVLMAASYLEDLLERLLRKFFVDNMSLTNNIFYGELSSFSSKINFAYLLGLISKNTLRDLHLIRKIRNEFAHSADFIGFSKRSITNRCYELKYDDLKEDLSPRNTFIRAVFITSVIIYASTTKEEGRNERSHEELDFINLIPQFEEALSDEIESYIRNNFKT